MSKSTHFTGHPIIKQLLNILDPALINRTAARQQIDRYYKRFKTYDHLVTRLFAALSGVTSLRELTTVMLACEGKINHLNMQHFPRRCSNRYMGTAMRVCRGWGSRTPTTSTCPGWIGSNGGFPSPRVTFRTFGGEGARRGCRQFLAGSVALHGKKAHEKTLCVDTTVQETNISFPTDAKLYGKVLGRLRTIAKQSGIKLTRSYRFVGKQLLLTTHNAGHPRRAKTARKATQKLRTCAGRLLHEVQRKLPQEAIAAHQPILELCEQVLKQGRHDKNKVYSLHEPHTACIAKGKAHKKYEFGWKVCLAITAN